MRFFQCFITRPPLHTQQLEVPTARARSTCFQGSQPPRPSCCQVLACMSANGPCTLYIYFSLVTSSTHPVGPAPYYDPALFLQCLATCPTPHHHTLQWAGRVPFEPLKIRGGGAEKGLEVHSPFG